MPESARKAVRRKWVRALLVAAIVFVLVGIAVGLIPEGSRIAGYELGQWHKVPTIPSVEFQFVRDEGESSERLLLRLEVDASPAELLKRVTNYDGYTETAGPQRGRAGFVESKTLARYPAVESITIPVSKKGQRTRGFKDVEVCLARFALDVPWLPDPKYTLLLVHPTRPESPDVHRIFWTQFDRENFARVSGQWKETCDIKGGEEFDTQTYRNTMRDTYGSWTFEAIEGERKATRVTYDTFADLGWQGPRFFGIRRIVRAKVAKRVIRDLPARVASILGAS